MSLTSKVQQYDVLLRGLFDLLDQSEGVVITCTRKRDHEQITQVLGMLRDTLEDNG